MGEKDRGLMGACTRCNGLHKSRECPKRLLIQGRYYRVLSVKDFAKRRRKALRAERSKALDYVSLWCPHYKVMLPISSIPIVGRMFVEAVKK